MFAPGLPPHNVVYESHPLKPNGPFEGEAAANDKLNKAELVTDEVQGSTLGYFMGPEAFAYKDGYLYTGIYGGDIIRLDLNSPTSSPEVGVWQTVARMHSEGGGGGCSGAASDEVNCGRPLGMDFDRWGFLMVADPYRGLVRVDVETGKTGIVLPPEQLVDGLPNLLMNAVAVSRKVDNVVYLSSSSSHFNFTDGVYEFLVSGTGRLLKHDMDSETTQVLMDNVGFSNGIALSPDEDYILVVESATSRIWKYGLSGADAGKKELFADDLPGVPDNIRSNGKGGYLVGMTKVHQPEDEVMLLKRVRAFAPLARGFARLMKLSQILFEFLDSVVPNQRFKMVTHQIGHLKHTTKSLTSTKYGLLLELDGQGRITKSWHSPDGSVQSVCDGYLHTDGYIYLGSPYNEYMARVKYD